VRGFRDKEDGETVEHDHTCSRLQFWHNFVALEGVVNPWPINPLSHAPQTKVKIPLASFEKEDTTVT